MRLLADMALFVEVARLQHFSRAAAALDMPASTLSRRITALEKNLGVRLIHRSTRSVSLTEAGESLYERARKLIAEAKQIHEDLSENESSVKGVLRIGVTSEIAQALLPNAFAAFSRSYPRIQLEIVSIQGHPNLLADALDIAFVVAHQTSLPDSAYVTRRIGVFPRYLFASKAYLERCGPISSPSDLVQQACLRLSRGRIQKEWELRRGKEKQVIQVNGPCSATSVGVLAQLARAGLGIVILPPFLVGGEERETQLEKIIPDWEAVPGYLFALTASRTPPAKIAALLQATKSELSGSPKLKL